VIRAPRLLAHEQGNRCTATSKPENILLTERGFGEGAGLRHRQGCCRTSPPANVDAHRDQARPEAIRAGGAGHGGRRTGIIGTMAYMSPEQWGRGRRDSITAPTIWATGLILFQMLTGRHPLETLGGDPRAWGPRTSTARCPSLRN